MPLVPTKSLFHSLPPAMSIGAFNVHNMEYTQAVVKAAEAERMPVILMLGEPILEFANLDMLATIAKFAAKQSDIPIAVALDHGKNLSNLARCVDFGLSVMVDGSHLPFDENVRFTKEIVQYAQRKGVSVEGEIGQLAGVEDVEDEQAIASMTLPQAAAEFAQKTGVDLLAISIGNCHGKYIHPPKLDMERLAKIHTLVKVPLVLHGGSDLPIDQTKKAIDLGIRKFNVGTDLKYAFSESLKGLLNETPMPFQPQDTLGVAREEVYRVTREKIRLFRNGQRYQL